MGYLKKNLKLFQPGKIFKKLYKITKACKRYHSPITFKYYIFLISYLRFYVKGGFNDVRGLNKGLHYPPPSNEKSNKYVNFQIITNNMKAPILCLDFDGVIHSFKSGWKGARIIPDPPVEGAIEWLRSLLGRQENGDLRPRYLDFRVAIYSARSRYFFGRRAMQKWLMKYGLTQNDIKFIDFPLMKPQLFLQIDDRALTFTGTFPSVEEMKNFRPWHKK